MLSPTPSSKLTIWNTWLFSNPDLPLWYYWLPFRIANICREVRQGLDLFFQRSWKIQRQQLLVSGLQIRKMCEGSITHPCSSFKQHLPLQQGSSQQFEGKVLPPSMVTLGCKLGIFYQVTLKFSFLDFFCQLANDFERTLLKPAWTQVDADTLAS